MITRLFSAGLVILSLLVLASCTTARLTADGAKARVMDVDEVKGCEKKGSVTVSVRLKILKESRTAKQLRILARNSAVHMEGDTVVPVSSAANGQQTFKVYRCMP